MACRDGCGLKTAFSSEMLHGKRIFVVHFSENSLNIQISIMVVKSVVMNRREPAYYVQSSAFGMTIWKEQFAKRKSFWLMQQLLWRKFRLEYEAKKACKKSYCNSRALFPRRFVLKRRIPIPQSVFPNFFPWTKNYIFLPIPNAIRKKWCYQVGSDKGLWGLFTEADSEDVNMLKYRCWYYEGKFL